MHQGVGLIADVDQLAEFPVFLGVHLGIRHHSLDFRVGQSARRLDDDLLLLASRLVLRGDVQDTVRVDIERDLDLRNAARCRGDFGQIEPAERLVVRSALTLTLQNMNRHRSLIVVGGREDLRCLCRNRRILLDQSGHHLPERLDPQRQRGHVEQQHVLDVARQHAGLDRRAHGHDLVRIDVLARLLAEEVSDLLDDLRHPRLTADQDDIVDLTDLEARVLQRNLARLDGARDQILDQRLELGARELDIQVLRSAGVGRDVRQVDLGLLRRRELDLGLLGGLLEALHRQRILTDIDAALLLEFACEVPDDPQVEVLAAEERVAVRRQHLELVLAVDLGDLDDRDVERAAAQVIDRDLSVASLFVHPVGQSGRGRLVDDALDFESGDLARILGGLALGVVEVSRHGDDGLGDRLAEVVFRRLLHLHQHARGYLRRRHLLAVRLDPGVAVVGFDDLVGNHL